MNIDQGHPNKGKRTKKNVSIIEFAITKIYFYYG